MLDSPTTLAVLRKKENMMHSRNDQFKNCKNERESLLEGRIVQSRRAQGPPVADLVFVEPLSTPSKLLPSN
jgi:hypothetical protein